MTISYSSRLFRRTRCHFKRNLGSPVKNYPRVYLICLIEFVRRGLILIGCDSFYILFNCLCPSWQFLPFHLDLLSGPGHFSLMGSGSICMYHNAALYAGRRFFRGRLLAHHSRQVVEP